jgi:hypothetical protein
VLSDFVCTLVLVILRPFDFGGDIEVETPT